MKRDENLLRLLLLKAEKQEPTPGFSEHSKKAGNVFTMGRWVLRNARLFSTPLELLLTDFVVL